MFENLPEFSKFQKIYNDKIKEEEMKQKQAEHDDGAPEKWKMKFAKDERQADTKQRGSKQQFGFNYESDEEDQARNFQSQAPATTTSNYGAGTSGSYDKNKKRSPPPKPKPEYIAIPPAPIHMIPKGPVVLDKFGNFRLADPGVIAPPKPLEPTSSTRRSRSRDGRRTRSNSRSPRRRRSSSHRRRHSRSRSYSRFASKSFFLTKKSFYFFYFRSYSRSRSRSRGRRVFRGRGGFNSRPRFSPKRIGQSSRGRWNNNFRDTRDFRGGHVDRFRDRPGGRGGRFGGRFNRSFSRSPERSPNRHVSPERRDGRWGEEERVGKPDLEDMDEILKKARKEKLDDMLERNKDLVKKGGAW